MTKMNYVKQIAIAVSLKSTCPQDKVGAIFITSDHEVLSTGYNGAPRGLPHCEKDCSGKCQNAVHAEANAIVQAAKRGHALQGSSLYITRWPCKACAMMIVNLGVKEVISWGKVDNSGMVVLIEAKIPFYYLNDSGFLGPIPGRES